MRGSTTRTKFSLRVLLAAGLPLTALLSGCLSSAGSDIEQLSIADEDRPLKEFDLFVAAFGTTSYSPREGVTLNGFGFSLAEDEPATVPGPELRVTQGDRVRVTLHTSEPHTIHWHGISVPWAMDGVPFMTQTTTYGDVAYVYEFNADETGTYWYHCHVDAPTHIDFGLFGAFIVEPKDPTQDPPFDREETLILHEQDSHHFFHNGAFRGEPTEQNPPDVPTDIPRWAESTPRDAYELAGLLAWLTTCVGEDVTCEAPGHEGPRDYYPDFSIRYHPYYDTFMINGKSFPETEPVHVTTGETVRLRLINAGQLIHTIHLHGHHALVTHKDGYPLPEAARYYVDSLMVAPGERYDLYVKANNPGVWDLHDHGGSWELGAYAANDHAFPGGMNTMLVYDDFEYANLPEPAPEGGWTSGDYMVFAESYKGLIMHGTGGAHHRAADPVADAGTPANVDAGAPGAHGTTAPGPVEKAMSALSSG